MPIEVLECMVQAACGAWRLDALFVRSFVDGFDSGGVVDGNEIPGEWRCREQRQVASEFCTCGGLTPLR